MSATTPVAVAHDEVPRRRADVVAVVRVGGVPDDALVLLVERVHRPPRERDPVGRLEHARGDVAAREAGDRVAAGLVQGIGNQEPADTNV
ncbi:MAG TPA: hypothetical protein VGP26_23315 [Actinophytocola sp.]|nr:hypothetical protein [Actinophytocola sp.]